MVASKRRRNNFIAGIENERGNWCDEPHKIDEVFMRYFNDIFTSMGPTNMDNVFFWNYTKTLG